MEISDQLYRLMEQTGNPSITLPELILEKDALFKIAPYIQRQGAEKVALVVDHNTYQAAGKTIEKTLRVASIDYQIVQLEETDHGQVIADEQSLVQLLVETDSDVDLFLAVGSGTIHDIVRFAGSKMNRPFISVPTAASVDGFTSKGAPLILRGVKKTIQTASPIAVFADVHVLISAPQALTAAGFGDILGKYTSLLDWKISELIGSEPYYPIAAELTRKSLVSCVERVEQIAARDQAGIQVLTQALIESGLVMLVLDFSRPASGGEHHLSHYWEMNLLEKNKEQLLHGAKVGVATAIISNLYHQFVENFEPSSVPQDHRYYRNIQKHWDEIKQLINTLPTAEEIQTLLKIIGGPQTTEQLELTNELVKKSLNEAQHLRDRCTGLLLINQFKKDLIDYPL
ncbi:glycerol-1-phosphate dehydrogenase [NAD(P)+] [Natronobacillus azotifigens]|uniref:Sn-glycerol-1-phosphate dehydrogenase n=1 Tax=Natronobacillus azotifigens TaxID=472978 RepID=A0A9J6R9V9_9BACI|nr:sn-glycerol-1-phosphate dehydrogenase [Natronobacillus azotifigens]